MRGKAAIKRVCQVTLTYIILVILAAFCLMPLAWIFSTSIKPLTEVFSIPPRWVPKHPTLANYRMVLTQSSMPRYFLNSFLVGAISTLISLLLGGTAGYGLARYTFPGSRGISLSVLLGQMLPLTVVLVPIYLLIDKLGLVDTLLGLALAHLTLTMPLVIWMARSYFLTVPVEIEEAAQIDGCSYLQALFRVTLPLSAPGIAAIAIYGFLMSWNEFVLANALTSSNMSRTLPIGLTEFAVMFKVDWGSTMAAAVLITVPVVLFFFLLQKYFVKGMTHGAIKG